jgi:hypothetical protein
LRHPLGDLTAQNRVGKRRQDQRQIHGLFRAEIH